MSYAVEINNVHKRFGRIHALRGLSLNIERGMTYGLLGPNGAGKTTLIRSIMGLVKPDEGQVKVLDAVMPSKDIMRRVGYMTQSIALYEDLTVHQNVAFFAAMYELEGDHAQAIREVLELVDLADRADSRVRELSGGMQRRVSLACALVHRPDVVVLDEPTVGVDPQLRVQFWDHFHQLNAQGVTLIVSSHVMDEAERCDRLGFVRHGTLLAEGSASELLERAGTPTLEEAFLKYAEQGPAQ
ncbi:MAG TPA: ABC transporter ATP-binding protein [Aggregatilinea sp.]|jgi:ABC-2 type transport system ATP-binding protein|uniref:ABC transporter ATP-binding protein n=1 Tax=Aggregatilinea sp. TaxID=2806333 RepID=UPI002CE5C0ED|nr:ABC transporter ATP-binding protein [Aggregatilinea sp.]HML23316.1 ABC transporter ATP-binding protein [Aggregatilinea sp.]